MKETGYNEPTFTRKAAWLGFIAYIVVALMIAWVFI